MAPPLPPPGQLIVENLILLSGSSTAFHNRYGHHISPTTFSKPGNSAPAHAVLHFLLCVIDGDIAHTQFKPCFPILDREQERDFRKVVDIRLALLEKNKLLPQGAARKSVIAAAGGDRFVDLLWSLSALAVQQACVRHPPYASASRLRLESPIPLPPPSVQSCGRADSTLSHQSSARSSRSLMSVNFRGSGGGAHDIRGRDASKQRRFLGAGMVSAAQQKAREADSVRSRIHAERTTLARTAELGKVGEKTWASEAESLRERIGEFEAKVRRLKGQLADMGFDEMGNDIRGKERDGLRKSCSGEELSDELKTSPIESMESGSSVDELLEPGDGCEDIAQDLSRILAFAAETKEGRQEVERVFPSDGAVIVVGNEEKDGLKTKEVSATGDKPKDMVQLVRAAADELEQATRRMDEIQEARKKAEETEAVLNTSVDGSESGEKSIGAFDPSVGKAMIESALLEHKNLVDSSQNLAKVALELTEISRDDVKKIPLSESDDSLQTIDPVATIPKPTWLNEAAADASEPKLTYANQPAISDGSKCSSDEVDTARDLQNLCKAFSSNASPRQTPRPSSSNSRRVKASPPKHPERHHSRHVRSNSASISPRSRLDSLHGTPSSYLSAKAARSVRFAALPPSYSANRTVGYQREETHLRARRQTSDVFPRSHDASAVEEDERSDTEGSEIGSVRDDRSDSGRGQSNPRRGERRDTYARKDLAPARRAVDEKSENQPRVPRVSRTQTPRRVVRRKEAIQRSVVRASAVTTANASERNVPLGKARDPTHSANVAEPQGKSGAVEAETQANRAATIAPNENKSSPEAVKSPEVLKNAGSLDTENDGTMPEVKEAERLSGSLDTDDDGTTLNGEEVDGLSGSLETENDGTTLKVKEVEELSGSQDTENDGNMPKVKEIEALSGSLDTENDGIMLKVKEIEAPSVSLDTANDGTMLKVKEVEGVPGSLDTKNNGPWPKVKEVEGPSCVDLDPLLCETEEGILKEENESFITGDQHDSQVPNPGLSQAEERETGGENVTETAEDPPGTSVGNQPSEQGSQILSDKCNKSTVNGSISALNAVAEDVASVRNSDIRCDDKSKTSGDGENGNIAETLIHDIDGDSKNTDVSVTRTQAAVVSETQGLPPSTTADLVDTEDRTRAKSVDPSTTGPILEMSGLREHRGDTTTEGLLTEDESIVPTNTKFDSKAVNSGTSPAKENVQKKLFMTPQSTRGQGRDRQRSPNLSRRSLAWKAAGSLLGNKYPSKGNVPISQRKDARQSGYLPPLKAHSPAYKQGEDPEILFSPAGKPGEADIAGSAQAARGGKGEGFFAGQTAQWQHSVQSQRAATGGRVPSSSRLSPNVSASDSSGGQSRETSTSTGQTAQRQHSVQSQRAATGRRVPSSSRLSPNASASDSSGGQSRETSKSSARRSRMKSLRARLAAAMK